MIRIIVESRSIRQMKIKENKRYSRKKQNKTKELKKTEINNRFLSNLSNFLHIFGINHKKRWNKIEGRQ